MKAHFRSSASFKRSLGLWATLLFGATLTESASVSAQEYKGAINVERFGSAAGPRNYLVTRGARTDGEHAFGVGLLAHYGYKPLVVDSVNADTNEVTEVLVVENLVTADALISYTPIPRLQLGLRFPVTYVKGQGLAPDGGAGQLDGFDVKSLGISDPELELKGRVLGEVDSPFVLGVAAFITAPLGEATAERQFIGAKGVTGGGRLIADYAAGPFSAAANVGFRGQKKGSLGGSTVGKEALYGLGLGVQAGPIFQIVADLFGTSAVGGGDGTSTLELGLGARIRPLNSPISFTLGGGPGLIHSIGGPVLRAFVGISYVNEAEDLDGDGFADSVDQCPADPEDVDGFEDSDGCPDKDNDGDVIADDADKCPDQPEDMDQFEDLDGCPEEDNDKDGLADVSDRCPNEPENINGFEDEDGCPDVPDTDKDGVNDPDDKCPNEAEDTDGFEDTDGCPDLDNDGDGIPDDQDECIDEPEDKNGTADEDGCPDEGEEPPAPSRRSKPSGGGGSRLGSEDNPIEL